VEAGRCQAKTKEGKPCSATPRPGRPYCLWHDPDAEATRRENARKGGQSRSNLARLKRSLPAEPLTFGDVQNVLGAVLRDLLAGTLDPPVANAAATVARAFAAIAQAGEMEERLRELELRAGVRDSA
jgi:hypothetical protein